MVRILARRYGAVQRPYLEPADHVSVGAQRADRAAGDHRMALVERPLGRKKIGEPRHDLVLIVIMGSERTILVEHVMASFAQNNKVAIKLLTTSCIRTMMYIELDIPSITNLTSITSRSEQYLSPVLPFWTLKVVLIRHCLEFTKSFLQLHLRHRPRPQRL